MMCNKYKICMTKMYDTDMCMTSYTKICLTIHENI